MNILHVISGNDCGGGKIHVFNICKNNKLFNNFICCIGSGELYNESKNIAVSLLLKKNILFNKNKKKLKDFIIENKIDIVNCHGPVANVYYCMNKIDNIICTTTVHSDFRYDFIDSKFKNLIYPKINEFYLKTFKHYICVCSKFIELLNNLNSSSNKYLIHNGIDVNIGNYDKYKMRENLNIDKEDFVFGITARFHPIKNHINLIKAFNILTKKYKNIKLLLIGDGSEFNNVKNEVKNLKLEENIIFTGKVHNPLLYMCVEDTNIIASLSESFPLTILEASILGIPSISTDVGDVRNIIDGEYIIKSPNYLDICSTMEYCICNRNLLQNEGLSMKNKILTKFSLIEFQKKYFKIYKNMLQKEDVN